jgi:PAS domain-containing protein
MGGPVKDQSRFAGNAPSAMKSEGERRVHRSISNGVLPPSLAGTSAGVNIGSDTEILQKLVRQLRLERAFLQTVLDQMPLAVVIAEAPSGRLILANPRLPELLREPFFAALSIEQYDHWHAYRPDGSRYEAKQWPLSRALLFGEVILGEMMRIRRGDRTWGLFEVSASPIRDEKGLIAAGVASLQDVSDRDWAQHIFDLKPAAKTRKKR